MYEFGLNVSLRDREDHEVYCVTNDRLGIGAGRLRKLSDPPLNGADFSTSFARLARFFACHAAGWRGLDKRVEQSASLLMVSADSRDCLAGAATGWQPVVRFASKVQH
jgi:hypothetical protein